MAIFNKMARERFPLRTWFPTGQVTFFYWTAEERQRHIDAMIADGRKFETPAFEEFVG